MPHKNKDPFSISHMDLIWSAKTFILSVLTAFVLDMVLYTTMLITSEPAPVDDAIISTATAATAKVVVAAEHISPMWAIFIFNTIAALSASAGTALFLLIHPLMISDIRLRPDHHMYASLSIAFERMLMPGIRLLQRLAHHLDAGFPYTVTNKTAESGFWKYSGYSREDYRMLAYMLPYTVPFLILIVNGTLMGILLAFFVFNGFLTGFEMFGVEGILIGMLYNLTYFVISIVPHGIIEIPALLLAAALGYSFARIQSGEVTRKALFIGDDPENIKKDVSEVLATVKLYLTSSYLWKMSALVVLMLFFAAYIEASMTQDITDRVMQVLDDFVETKLL